MFAYERKSVSHIVRSVIDLCFDFIVVVVVLASLAEKDALVTSLQEELREVKEKTTTDAVRLS